jgi:hypothetical protein
MRLLLTQRAMAKWREPTQKSLMVSRLCTYDGLKKHGQRWIDELLCTLWGNRTSPSQATGETPFFMVYGVEVILPLEGTMGSLRVQAYNEAAQGQLRYEDIGLVDERRWQSAIKNVWYRQALKRYQEWFMRSREL